jgi:hypothetical protein
VSEYREPTEVDAAQLHNSFTAMFQLPQETRPKTFAEAMLYSLKRFGYKIEEPSK